MKHKSFIFFLCGVLVSLSMSVIFADDLLEETNIDTENNTVQNITEDDLSSPAQVVVDITQLLNQNNKENDIEVDQVEVIEPQLISVEVENLRISPSDTNGFKAVMLQIIGDYEPTVTDYTYQQNNYQYLSHSINIERDWSWICSCGVFALLLYFTFRTIGGICARF